MMEKKQNYLLDKDLALLRRKGRVIKYAINETILGEKETNKKLFWLLKGSVRIELSSSFRNIVLANIRAGEMFGEISFLGETEASANVIANKDVEVLVVDGEQMDDLLSINEGFAARFYRTAAVTLAQRLRFQTRTLK
jgi:CRP/FNR family cyclic AMP-dependent transcriptional regulator